jgi:hypothetical protein
MQDKRRRYVSLNGALNRTETRLHRPFSCFSPNQQFYLYQSMIAEKAAVYEARKGLEGCEAVPAHSSAGTGAERSPGKPGFRRLRRKCAQITGKNLCKGKTVVSKQRYVDCIPAGTLR